MSKWLPLPGIASVKRAKTVQNRSQNLEQDQQSMPGRSHNDQQSDVSQTCAGIMSVQKRPEVCMWGTFTRTLLCWILDISLGGMAKWSSAFSVREKAWNMALLFLIQSMLPRVPWRNCTTVTTQNWQTLSIQIQPNAALWWGFKEKWWVSTGLYDSRHLCSLFSCRHQLSHRVLML